MGRAGVSQGHWWASLSPLGAMGPPSALDPRVLRRLDRLAEQLAEAAAAPYIFWLGADRRMPGDEPLDITVENLSAEGLNLRRAIFALLSDLNTAQLEDLAALTRDVDPRLDALKMVLKDRSGRIGKELHHGER